MSLVAEQGLKSRRFSRDVESQKLVNRLFDSIKDVSSLPAAALRILEVTGDPHSEAEDLLQSVESDPAIAARIMRIVNSSFYPLRESVGELKTAITLLGFSEIRNLALTACISTFFDTGGSHKDYSRKGLWNHSIGVGTVSKAIARNTGLAGPGEAYLAGLLHDLGLILIDQHIHRPFCGVLDRLTVTTPTCAVESTVLGFDHAELGSYIARRWQFPGEVIAAIRHHHHADQDNGPFREMVCIVSMANFLCTLHGLSSLGVRNVPEPSDVVIGTLNFRPDDVSRLQAELGETLSHASIIAGV